MARRVSPVLIALVAALCLTSCGFLGRPERPIWRAQAENACFARKQVALSDAIVPSPEIDGPGICGMTRPLKVSALDNGSIAVDQTLTIDCPIILALEAWLNAIVEPGPHPLRAEVATAEAFRPIAAGASTPARRAPREHAFGNAVDVAGFTLADGREIDLVRDWKTTDTQEAAFLHEVHAALANISPRSEVLARTCSTTTTSISISPITARPTPALGASASRRLRPTSCRRLSPATACRRRPILKSPWTSRTSARRAPSRPRTPRLRTPRRGQANGPDGALPPAPFGGAIPRRRSCRPPLHPHSVDRSPTSSRPRPRQLERGSNLRQPQPPPGSER